MACPPHPTLGEPSCNQSSPPCPVCSSSRCCHGLWRVQAPSAKTTTRPGKRTSKKATTQTSRLAIHGLEMPRTSAYKRPKPNRLMKWPRSGAMIFRAAPIAHAPRWPSSSLGKIDPSACDGGPRVGRQVDAFPFAMSTI